MFSQKKILLLLFIFCHSVAFNQKLYIKKYKSLADSLSKVYQIPVKVILAVAIIESSSGTGRNAKLLNNHFGIVGKNNLIKTKGIKTMYKQYSSDYESYLDFIRLICKKKYYKELKGDPSCEKWVKAISLQGYSIYAESWRKVIMKTVNSMKL